MIAYVVFPDTAIRRHLNPTVYFDAFREAVNCIAIYALELHRLPGHHNETALLDTAHAHYLEAIQIGRFRSMVDAATGQVVRGGHAEYYHECVEVMARYLLHELLGIINAMSHEVAVQQVQFFRLAPRILILEFVCSRLLPAPAMGDTHATEFTDWA